MNMPPNTQHGFSQNNTQRAKIEWTHVKDIERGGVVVRITSSGGYRPRYSVSIGRFLPLPAEAPESTEPRFTQHLGVFVDGQGTLQLRSPMALAIGEAVQEAEGWILNECQKTEDSILEDRVKKETKQANFGKPAVPRTGKTEREREKRKNKNKG